MDCTQARELISAYADHELEVTQTLALERHISECAACARQYREQRALRNTVKTQAPYYNTPESLRARLSASLDTQTTRTTPALSRRNTRWLEIGMSMAAGVVMTLGLSFYLVQPRQPLTDELVAGHVRSLMAGHLADVASTDQHTVKPWFAGKLDYSPPVRDLAVQGFPLTGGRLDYIGRRAVAALVYRRHQHVINLYVWPATKTGDALRTESRSGYNLEHWSQAGMEYWAVSDLNLQELEEFARELQLPELPAR